MNKSVDLCSLWIRKGKSGRDFYSGKLGNLYVNIFFNDRKRKDSNDPDAFLSLSQPDKQYQAKPQGPAQQQNPQHRPAPQARPQVRNHAPQAQPVEDMPENFNAPDDQDWGNDLPF